MVVVAFAGDCLRDCHSGFLFWDFYFVSCKTRTSERTNERTNKQTNKQIMLASPRIYPEFPRIAPYAVAHKRGQLKIEFGFQKKQKLVPDFEGCHCGVISVHGGRTATVLRPRMRSNHCAQQQTRRQHLQALISLYPGQTTRILLA